jgi:capsular polysaccharide transport system permease protein
MNVTGIPPKPRWLDRFDRLFMIAVVVPTLLSTVYFGFWASDTYTSESSFVVRSPEKPSASAIGVLLKGAGFSSALDESYTVQKYIQSRDALLVLTTEMALDKAYASTKVDVFSRFAGLDSDNSFEALHRYYQNKVSVLTDSNSSISNLTVKAFSAQDAQRANQLLLERSEALVNRLNERGRQDLIRFAKAEVDQAADKAKEASLALSNYRNTQGVVDPERQATAQLQQVAKIQDELIATTIQLSQLKAFTPDNPQIASLENRANILRSEIAKETGKVMGGQASLSNKAVQFQRLALEADLANKQLASALVSLEAARNEALRKQVYLERIAEPNLPDVAQEPRRLRNILATLMLGLVAWGILSMLVAGVREHQD